MILQFSCLDISPLLGIQFFAVLYFVYISPILALIPVQLHSSLTFTLPRLEVKSTIIIQLSVSTTSSHLYPQIVYHSGP